MEWTTVIIIFVLIGSAIHLMIESFYFLRIGICFVLAKFFKKKIHILEKCSLNGKLESREISLKHKIWNSFVGICTTRDVDMILTHMNNARYFREVDLARIDFYIRSRLYEVVKSQKGQILLGAASVRFRKFIGIFARFKLTTKIIYWNEDNIFIEHKVSKLRRFQCHWDDSWVFGSSSVKMDSFMQRCFVNNDLWIATVKSWWTFC